MSTNVVPGGGESDDTKLVRYWELVSGKDPQMIFDETILRPLVDEFECFRRFAYSKAGEVSVWR